MQFSMIEEKDESKIQRLFRRSWTVRILKNTYAPITVTILALLLCLACLYLFINAERWILKEKVVTTGDFTFVRTAFASDLPKTTQDKIRAAFGTHADTFLKIATAESGQQAGNKGYNCIYGGKSMGVKIGSVIHISFTEEVKAFTNTKGEEIKYTDRFIGSMREAGGNPQLQQEKPRQGANNAPQGQEKDDSFWDKKAYKQCLWNYWLQVKAGKEDLLQADADMVWKQFQGIERDAEKRFSPVAQAALKANPDFFEDTAPVEPSIQVEDIPF